MNNINEFKEFVELVHKTKNKALLEDFLYAITTAGERHTLARRIEIVRRLLNGDAQHHIASDLKVGVGTVGRGAREIAEGHFNILK